MLSVPASPHLVGQDLGVEAEELCDLEAVLTEQDQFAPFPVLPSRAVNTDLASRLAGRPAVLAAYMG